MPDSSDTMGGDANSMYLFEDEFSSIAPVALDSMYAMKELMAKDNDPRKVNVAPGAYRDENGKPWVLPSFAAGARLLVKSKGYNHEYLSLAGQSRYLAVARQIVFGDDVAHENIASLQTCGGTGALHMAAGFLYHSTSRPKTVLIPEVTWVNHVPIFQHVGWQTQTYSYYDRLTSSLSFDLMVRDLQKAPRGSVIVLHAVAHNPTGTDPSLDEWKTLAEVFRENNLFALFDCAYQGFASGSLEEDRRSIDIFRQRGVAMCVCQSFSKNAGLYGERVGALHVICATPKSAELVQRQLKVVLRKEISTAPRFGADLVALVYDDPELRRQWIEDLKHMAHRISSMRSAIAEKLKSRETPGDWDAISQQRGMFGYFPLTPQQCQKLTHDHHIYLPQSGRVMLGGLTDGNVDYVANAIDQVVRNN